MQSTRKDIAACFDMSARKRVGETALLSTLNIFDISISCHAQYGRLRDAFSSASAGETPTLGRDVVNAIEGPY